MLLQSLFSIKFKYNKKGKQQVTNMNSSLALQNQLLVLFFTFFIVFKFYEEYQLEDNEKHPSSTPQPTNLLQTSNKPYKPP